MIIRQTETQFLARLTHIWPDRLPLCLRVNSLVTVIFLLSGLIVPSLVALMQVVRVTTITASGIVYPDDPLANYRSIMPGQPAAALEGYACQQPPARLSGHMCTIFPEDDLFHLINVTIEEDLIVEMELFSEFLQLGDLIHLWGEPQSMRRGRSGQTVTLNWDTGSSQVLATVMLAGYQPHVRLVTLTLDEG